MCGIAGIIHKNKVDHSNDLKKILKQIQYRGPDETGIATFQNLSIGMNRLAIIDSKKHNIPYYDDEKKIWAVFNGEIYNFKQLIREFSIKKNLELILILKL